MSYIAATAPTSGPPGPLRIPGVQLGATGRGLGAVEPHSHSCTCKVGALGDADPAKSLLILGGLLGTVLYLSAKASKAK